MIPSASDRLAIRSCLCGFEPVRELLEAAGLWEDGPLMDLQPEFYVRGVRIGCHEGDPISEVWPPVHDDEGQGEPRHRWQANIHQNRINGLTGKEGASTVRLSGCQDAIPQGREGALERRAE
jgi:hypothetical protein